MTTSAPPPTTTRPPLWRDVRVLRVAVQVAFAIGIGALAWYLASNLLTNLRVSGIPTGFGFLDQPTGFSIRDTNLRPAQPISDAVLAGVGNTLRVAVVGIALATLVGLFVGIARLSSNWLVRRAASLYVETIRNVPPLLVIVFFYLAVMLRLPPITEAVEWLGAVVLSNRRVAVLWGDAGPGVNTFLVVLAGAFVVAVLVGWWRTRVFDETGKPHHRVLWGAGILLVAGAVAYVVLGEPVALSSPAVEGRLIEGGTSLGLEYAAVLVGLVVYTASHIAEIVRGSIQAVPRGQTEAATAIALSSFQRLRYVVLPQALRIIIPPLGNQYLNLTKNSSLAVAVGYPELTQVTKTVIGNGHPAVQSVAVLMLAYLVLSLVLSLATNTVNRLVGRRGG